MNKETEKLKQDIEAYKQSEQEATEIIAELKHTLDCKNGTIETLKAENERLNKILQEIKEIAERCNLCEECSGVEDCERECGDAVEPCSTYQMQIIVNKLTKAEEE